MTQIMQDSDGPTDGMQHIIDKFTDSLPLCVERLKICIDSVVCCASTDVGEGNISMQELQQHAHKLAGTAGSVGFPDLTRRARDLELLIKQINKSANSGLTTQDVIRLKIFTDELVNEAIQSAPALNRLPENSI